MHRAMAIRTMRSPPRLIVTVGRSIARPAVATSASAVSCGEEWRRADLGTLLIMLLAQAAAERGVHTFSVSYLAGNRPVAALVEDAVASPGQAGEGGRPGSARPGKRAGPAEPHPPPGDAILSRRPGLHRAAPLTSTEVAIAALVTKDSVYPPLRRPSVS